MPQPHEPFDEETIAALKELGRALQAAHESLIAEGYTIVDGKYIAPKN